MKPSRVYLRYYKDTTEGDIQNLGRALAHLHTVPKLIIRFETNQMGWEYLGKSLSVLTELKEMTLRFSSCEKLEAKYILQAVENFKGMQQLTISFSNSKEITQDDIMLMKSKLLESAGYKDCKLEISNT